MYINLKPMEFARGVLGRPGSPYENKDVVCERTTNVDDLLKLIQAEHEFNWFAHQCSK